MGAFAASGCHVSIGPSAGFVDLSRAVPDDGVRYLGGSAGALLPGTPSSGAVDATLVLDGDSTLDIDARRLGVLSIPYGQMSDLTYGPDVRLLSGHDSSRGGPARAYPWSTDAHRFRHHYLKISFRDPAGTGTETVVLGIGRSRARPLIDQLERKARRRVRFEVLEACLQCRTAPECGMGSPAELKDAVRVFVDTGGSREWTAGESYDRIIAVLDQARPRPQIVTRAADAQIVLAFRYIAGTRPQWLRGSNDVADRAVGEVYVGRLDGLRILMTFDEDLSAFRTHLATRFAAAFVDAYQKANAAH